MIPEILSGIGGAILASGGWYFVACRYDRVIAELRLEIAASDQAGYQWWRQVDRLAETAARFLTQRNKAIRELEQERAAKQGRDALGKFAAKVRA